MLIMAAEAADKQHHLGRCAGLRPLQRLADLPFARRRRQLLAPKRRVAIVAQKNTPGRISSGTLLARMQLKKHPSATKRISTAPCLGKPRLAGQ